MDPDIVAVNAVAVLAAVLVIEEEMEEEDEKSRHAAKAVERGGGEQLRRFLRLAQDSPSHPTGQKSISNPQAQSKRRCAR